MKVAQTEKDCVEAWHRARTEACTATAIKKAVKNIGHDALTERYKARFQSQ